MTMFDIEDIIFSNQPNKFKNIPEEKLRHFVNKIDQNYIDTIVDRGNFKIIKYLLENNYISQESINYSELIFRDDPVTTLRGVEVFQNLKTLILVSCPIRTLKPLKYLTNLKALVIFNTNIKDVYPVKNLTNLKTLNITINSLFNNDVSILKNLKNLEELSLSITKYNYSYSDFYGIERLPLDVLNIDHIDKDGNYFDNTIISADSNNGSFQKKSIIHFQKKIKDNSRKSKFNFLRNV